MVQGVPKLDGAGRFLKLYGVGGFLKLYGAGGFLKLYGAGGFLKLFLVIFVSFYSNQTFAVSPHFFLLIF